MLYSSGTTGNPKGVLRPLPDQPPGQALPIFNVFSKFWRFREGQIYLMPAPLYHSAPLVGAAGTIRLGGALIVMERFNEEHFLQLVEQHRVTHTQLVPTMFSRLVKLPEAVRRRYDLSSLEAVVHGAAPCPVPVKQAMIDWWGPVIHEYYSATEGMGLAMCDSAEWLAHPGTVGRTVAGELHVLDDADAGSSNRRDRQAVVQDRLAVRIFQRSGQDRGGELARPDDEHRRRHRPCRRGGLHLPHRPRRVHDHFRRRQCLSAGMREPLDHPSQGRRRRRVRRAERGSGRGGQGRGAADARVSGLARTSPTS